MKDVHDKNLCGKQVFAKNANANMNLRGPRRTMWSTLVAAITAGGGVSRCLFTTATVSR